MNEWNGRPLVVDHQRNVDREMLETKLTTSGVIEVLETGVSPVKRKRGIIERWLRKGWHMTVVVVEDCGDYWLIRHVGRLRITRRLSRMLGGRKA
jgi:tRNA U54 and U55 pseudouridine synthase Pus10